MKKRGRRWGGIQGDVERGEGETWEEKYSWSEHCSYFREHFPDKNYVFINKNVLKIGKLGFFTKLNL